MEGKIFREKQLFSLFLTPAMLHGVFFSFISLTALDFLYFYNVENNILQNIFCVKKKKKRIIIQNEFSLRRQTKQKYLLVKILPVVLSHQSE